MAAVGGRRLASVTRCKTAKGGKSMRNYRVWTIFLSWTISGFGHAPDVVERQRGSQEAGGRPQHPDQGGGQVLIGRGPGRRLQDPRQSREESDDPPCRGLGFAARAPRGTAEGYGEEFFVFHKKFKYC